MEERFKTRLRTGTKFEDYVAQKIAEHGFMVDRPVEIVNGRFTQEQKDVVVGGMVLEVKSRKLRFTSPQDFPYSTIIVDGAWGFDQKDKKPKLYVFVSQITGAMMVLDVEQTRQFWEKILQNDPHMVGTPSEKYYAYVVGRQFLQDESYLYKWLERRVPKL